MVHRNFEGHFLVEHPAGKKENDEERRDAILSFSRPSEAEKEQMTEGMKALETKNKEFDKLVAYNESLKSEVADFKKKNEFLFEEIAKERLRLETRIETLVENLDEKKKEYSIKEFEVTQLQKENSDLTSYKRQVLTLEQEKRDLESQLVTVVSESRMRAAKSPSPATTDSTLGDDNLKMQIDFLNSVIVDMQKKNDKLSAQLEIYETAGILGEETNNISYFESYE